VQVWLGAIDEAEMQELVVDAWRMVVSKSVASAYDAEHSGLGNGYSHPP
jgi:hypothetical protein